ncbi:hypothetical protein BK666_28120 [Pseudomonas frederiksbergensis]|uniref:Delta-60 repeat domain-containing protein n=1 Tax=Pseudomonas frederiksbergensis TaxID=104087 RepID=A0A423JNE4_9PSED|nr:hypothetical protein [Pseudomonas frederiksbergensis]RON39213.1 hypothetical protein BK666_28120 [Pseudomonas frederiksbergensis]
MNTNNPRRAGDRDKSFGIDGEVTLDILPEQIRYTRQVKGALVLPDNKVLLSLMLETRPYVGQYGLARLTPGGKLDLSFANGGLLIDSFKGDEPCAGGRLLRLTDGRLLMLGHHVVFEGENPIAHLAMACYSSDYTLDTTFGEMGTGHLIIENEPGEVYLADSGKVAQQADGKLLVCTTYYSVDDRSNTTGLLYRLHANGTLDKTFNQTGRLDFKVQDPDAPTALNACLPQADGKIVVAGHAHLQPRRATALVARLQDNGTLDRDFGHRNSPGYFSVGIGNRPTEFMELLSTSAGFVALGQVGDLENFPVEGLMVGLSKNGVADPGFNGGEPLRTLYDPTRRNTWQSGYVQSDGKLVTSTTQDYIYISRWLPDGSVDSEFGTDGYVTEGTATNAIPVLLMERAQNNILFAANAIGIEGSIGCLFAYQG